MKGIPAWGALPVAAAFLAEFPFYLVPAFDPSWLRNPALLTATCLVPWLVYTVARGLFGGTLGSLLSTPVISGFLLLLIVAMAVSFWYRILPAAPVADGLFLVLLAAIMLSGVFHRIYFSHIPKLDLSILGHLMLIRTAAIAILAIRGSAALEYRFIPDAREWLIGLRWFAITVPVCGAALWALGIARLRPHPHNPLTAIGEFLGILWVVALSEEFFFRGLLQQWLERWMRHSIPALIVSSLIFGSVHLIRGAFPNWRYAIVAGLLGLFCGLAWRESRGIQAGMVTHALAATLYRVFFV